MEKRPPAYAGSFYPDDPDRIKRMVEDFLTQPVEIPKGEIIGAVSPHAGYQYSGAIATLAHLCHRDGKWDRIVIIGPSHHAYFKDPVVEGRDFWITPLGEVEIDGEGRSILIGSGIGADHRPFDPEHSLEVQVPFIQIFSPGVKILPIMIGDQSLESGERVAQALSQLPGSTFILASSDLYHGYSYEVCKKTDTHTIEMILTLDPGRFQEELSTGRAMACGGGPIIALLSYGRKIGVTKAEVLRYTNSNDVTGTKGGYCVGYVAIAFLR